MTGVTLRIESRAKTVGNKAANLLELQELGQQITSLPLLVRVPELCTLDHQLVVSHLDKTAPNWRTLWTRFVEEQKKADAGSLSSESLATLKELRELVVTTFAKHPLSTADLQHYIGMLPEHALLMVRSTGKEDTDELANPGGNESIAAVAPDESAISMAIGEVVASYFSEKSLKQRLISHDDITEFPFIPVLLQRMIGEPLLGAEKPDVVIRSGVMYTGEAGTRIQLAPGHGELIVNSKAPFDTFFVSREQVVYSELYKKTHRLIPVEVEVDKKRKRKLELHPNPLTLQNQPAVPPDVAQSIAKVGSLIEQHYGIPMDVEFVYHPEENVLYLVQARPIPKGDLKSVIPSSIPPDKLVEIKKDGELCSAEVITPAGSAARVITKPQELLICDTIGQALEYYLRQKNSPIKAVIVRELAPETSHEAAQFNAKAIPVLAVEDLSTVKGWMKQKAPVVIVDPQRKQLVHLKKKDITHANAEQELRTAGIIKDGFFKSPLASQVTLLPMWKKKMVAPATLNSEKYEEQHTTIGDLILKVNSDDTKVSELALQQLLGLLLNQLNTLKKYPNPSIPPDGLFGFLKEQIAVLEGAEPGKKQNDEVWRALHATLTVFYQLAHSEEGRTEDAPYRKLFQQVVITAAELFRSLERLSNDTSGNTAIQQEHLGLVSKLEGMIIHPGKTGLFSDSLRQVAQEKKAFKNAQTHPGFDTLTRAQQRYFVEFFKLEKLALNDNLKKLWIELAFKCSSVPINIAKLAHFIKFSMAHDITSDILNQILIQAKKQGLSPEATLDRIMNEIKIIQDDLEKHDILKSQMILKAWERRISEWSDPRKFNALWNDYEREFLPLIKTLSIDKNMSNLTKITIIKSVQQMTEIMDKTIKAMKGSPEYEDALKVQYFIKLLEPYSMLVHQWVPKAQVHFNDVGNKTMLAKIDRRFKALKTRKGSNQLNPSGKFSVASACVGSTASFERQFGEHETTLEDMFTLFHQDMVATTSQLNSSFSAWRTTDLPKEIQPLVSALLDLRGCSSTRVDCRFPTVSVHMSLPIQNHAASFSVEFNQITKKTKLVVHFYGYNWGDRMNYIRKCAAFDARICGIREIYPAAYNNNTHSLEYGWELSPDQLGELAPHIKKQIQFYVNVTFDQPSSVRSGYTSTVNRKTGGVSHQQSIGFFKNTLTTESMPEEIERIKGFLVSLKKDLELHSLPRKQDSNHEFRAIFRNNTLNLKKCLDIDLDNIKNPYDIKELFYKVSTELAEHYYSPQWTSNEAIIEFYSEWYAKVFNLYTQNEKRRSEIPLIETDNARIARRYRDQIRPELIAIHDKIQDLESRYNKDKSDTIEYKEGAGSTREVLFKIMGGLATLEKSSEKGAVNTFIKACNSDMDEALKSNLAEHRGVKKGMLGALWDALLSLAQTFRLIDQERKDYLMSTDSAQKIMDLKTKLSEPIPAEEATEDRNQKSI